ncbi:unnamed protein product [Protopolystoma xenopodis]|uniref:Uncharacterized protein n=1 Tax=Protopolystoma xenopodis TaxID=117903 RepID=A0A448XQE2_9PLAT|nr:unnamed protein product [Protopolystoma xenopodis]
MPTLVGVCVIAQSTGPITTGQSADCTSSPTASSGQVWPRRNLPPAPSHTHTHMHTHAHTHMHTRADGETERGTGVQWNERQEEIKCHPA